MKAFQREHVSSDQYLVSSVLVGSRRSSPSHLKFCSISIKRLQETMKLKMNDLVQVMRGKEAGKQGKITSINKARTQVKVENISVVVKHQKPAAGRPGEILKKESFIDASNVMIIDPTTKKPTRIGYTKDKDGRKVRVGKKSGKPLDK